METAVSWEGAKGTHSGLPKPIAAMFQAAELNEPELLLAIAEHKVPLKGTGGDSQCDVWALVKTTEGTVSVSVEAKANEDFGDNNQTLTAWLKGGKSPGSPVNRLMRWHHIEENLPKGGEEAYHRIPFQILHRCAAAVIEARRFRLKHALFLVQSFNAPPKSFEKYALFASALGLPANRNRLEFTGVGDIRLGIGWVDCPFGTDAQMAAALGGEVLTASNDGAKQEP